MSEIKLCFGLGGPCSGKGTWIKGVQQVRTDVSVISMSKELLLKKEDPVVGPRVAMEMKLGLHVHHEVASECFWRVAGGVIYRDQDVIADGCIRTPQQALEYVNRLREHGIHKLLGIFIDTPADICLERMKERAKIENRVDDNESSMAVRMYLYEYVEKPAIQVLTELGIPIYRIDGRLEREERTRLAMEFLAA